MQPRSPRGRGRFIRPVVIGARVMMSGLMASVLMAAGSMIGGLLLGGCNGDEPVVAHIRFEAIGAERGFRFRHEVPGGRLDNLPKAAMGGLAVIDVDGDGRLDLYFVNGGWHPTLAGVPRPERPAPNRLLRNLGDLRFEDVTDGSGADNTGFGMGACVGDFDNDGAADIFVCNYGGGRLLRGRGDGTFEDVTVHAGIAPGMHTGAAFLDYDRDGLLDLFVGQYVNTEVASEGGMGHHGMAMGGVSPPAAYAPQSAVLYHNRGDGTFEDVTRAAGVARPGKAMGVLATDVDVDGWIDVVVANDTLANYVWRNRGDGTFEDAAPILGLAYGLDAGERGSMGVDAGDVDGDGRLDYLVPDTVGGCVYVARKSWFADRAKDFGLSGHVRPFVGWADVAFDVDLDGDIDIYKTHGAFLELTPQTSFLLVNEGEAGFDRPRLAGADWEACARGGVAVDLNDDGLQEIVVVALDSKALLLANRTRDAGNWVRLRLQGTKSNRMALGARITGRAGALSLVREVSGSTGYISAGDPRALFGLGSADALTDIRVRWPNGDVEELGSLEAGSDVLVVEGSGVR